MYGRTGWVLQCFIEKIATVDSEQTKTGVAIIRNLLSLPVVLAMIIGAGEFSPLSELAMRSEVWGQVPFSSMPVTSLMTRR